MKYTNENDASLFRLFFNSILAFDFSVSKIVLRLAFSIFLISSSVCFDILNKELLKLTVSSYGSLKNTFQIQFLMFLFVLMIHK